MFNQPPDTVLSMNAINTDVSRQESFTSSIQQLQTEITQAEWLSKQKEQYLNDVIRAILTRKLAQTNDVASMVAYENQRLETYKKFPETATTFSADETIESLEVLQRNSNINFSFHQQQLAIKKEEKAALEVKLQNLQADLLVLNPYDLLQNLATKMLAAFNKFERANPTNQATHLRHILFMLVNKVNALAYGNPPKQRTLVEIRIDYFRLFGLLARDEEQIALEIVHDDDTKPSFEIDKEFQQVLISLMCGTSISSTKDLFPDRWECKRLYFEYAREGATYFRLINIDEFKNLEIREYNTVYDKFKATMDNMQELVPPSVFAAIKNVQDEMNIFLYPLTASGKQDSYKYLTTLMKCTQELITTSYSIHKTPQQKAELLMEYKNLIAFNQSGKADTHKKMRAALHFLLGVVVNTLAVTAGIAGLLSLTFAAGSVVVGSAIILRGWGFFKEGRQKGLDYALNTVAGKCKPKEIQAEPRQNLLASYQP